MRHRKRLSKLGKAADQRKALLRSLTSQLFLRGEIVTTLPRARALVQEASRVMTWAKRGDLAATRQAARFLYNIKTDETFESRHGNSMPVNLVRHVFETIAPRFKDRQSGYFRVIQAPPRRGDNAKMAIVQMVD